MVEQEREALVVVPTYNEAGSLPALIEALGRLDPIFDCLIVDDNSPDGTGDMVRELMQSRPWLQLLERPGKSGLGRAYIAGFRWALERRYEYVLEMDADLSHDPRDIPRLIEACWSGADLALGSRYFGGVRIINWPIQRLLISFCGSMYTRFWTGIPLTDPTSGFKCFRRRVLCAIDLDRVRSNGYAFQIEMDLHAWRHGFKLVEVPIVFTERRLGHSKMNRAIVREAIWRVPLDGLRGRLGLLGRRRPAPRAD